MPTVNQYKTALIDTTPVQKNALYDALSKRGAYVIISGEDATDLTPPPLTTHLVYNGLIFWYDAADTTSAHDGVSTIVTFDAKRFKSDAYNGRGLRRYSVKDKSLATPPGSPAIGDAYIVAAGGTGAWTGKDKKIAVYTARSWVFIAPNVYDEALVVDELLIYHYSAGAVWTAGTPGVVLPAGGVNIAHLKYGLGLRVHNRTTVAPPGSPAEGDAYIPFTGASGAWAGHAGKVAIYESGAWTILAPVEGWCVFDKALKRPVYYNAGAWVDPLIASAQWEFIEDRVISSAVAQADFTDIAYLHLRLQFIGLIPSVTGPLNMRTSVDNGANFAATSGDYLFGTASMTGAQITEGTLSSSSIGAFGTVEIGDFGSAKRCLFNSNLVWGDNAASYGGTTTPNVRTSTAARNALRVLSLAGNLASGRIIIEGRN